MMKRIQMKLAAALMAAALLTTCVSAAATTVSSDVALREPRDVLVSGDTLYAADAGGHVVWQLKNGKTTAAAGYTDATDHAYPGYLDGSAGAALFRSPSGLAAWMDGIVVSDTENHTLRLLRDGRVHTLAGTGKAGDMDGGADKAAFNGPRGLAVDADGALLIADCWNGSIRKLTPDGRVSTYARDLGEPAALAWYGGTLYVADAGKNQILAIQNGKTTVLAGTGEDGLLDGDAAQAQFSYPMGIAADASGVYVSDTGNNVIRKISGGRVTTLVGDPESPQLWPVAPMGMALANGTLYVADAFAGVILRVSLDSPFADVSAGHTHYDGITWAVNQGITKGLSADRFGPGQACTRGQVVTFLWRAAGSPEPSGTAFSFTDVAKDSPFCQAILWAAEQGITRGVTETTFAPNAPVTRAQFVTFLWRYAGSPEASAPATFADVSGGYVHAGAITWAVAENVTRGTTETTFSPNQACTRGQTMTFLYRYLTQ